MSPTGGHLIAEPPLFCFKATLVFLLNILSNERFIELCSIPKTNIASLVEAECADDWATGLQIHIQSNFKVYPQTLMVNRIHYKKLCFFCIGNYITMCLFNQKCRISESMRKMCLVYNINNYANILKKFQQTHLPFLEWYVMISVGIVDFAM